MTQSEAKEIVDMLKQGKRFASRFQEQEWGLTYLPESQLFEEWGRKTDFGTGKTDSFSKNISEEEAIELMLKYSFEVVKVKLR